jgi:hypothetical protein
MAMETVVICALFTRDVYVRVIFACQMGGKQWIKILTRPSSPACGGGLRVIKVPVYAINVLNQDQLVLTDMCV